ncbi:MAG: MoxR family ATPase [Planctomycetota bacterium]
MKTAAEFLPRDLKQVRVDRKPDTEGEQREIEIVRHVFDADSISAVNGALASGRPLLVRGEPGVGKTQLAAAVAAQLDRPLVSYTLNSNTESTDLLWRFDAVQRLAEAQVCGTLELTEQQVRMRLKEWRFVAPGPLWWGFDWTGALTHLKQQVACIALAKGDQAQAAEEELALATVPDNGGDASNGVVVLIDEIDKADSDVPNGLLEALGARQFTPQGCKKVSAGTTAPLVIITTNQERVLPDAFIRRCLVMQMKPPGRADLIRRGEAHFGNSHSAVLETAADQLLEDREKALPPRPGLAEYLDLVRAVLILAPTQEREPHELIDELAEFTLRKQSGGRN